MTRKRVTVTRASMLALPPSPRSSAFICGEKGLRPIRPVQRPVLDGLGDVFGLDLRRAFEVGDRPRYFEDAVVRARRESLLAHGALQQVLAIGRQVAVDADLARAHLRIRINL